MAKHTGSLNQGRSVADMMAREFGIKGELMAYYHEFTPQEQERLSTQMSFDLLSGKTYIRGVDKKTGDEGERYVFDFDRQPRPTLTDLRLLAIEALKEPGATDPNLARALIDECIAQLGDADEPVTREWLLSLPCGFVWQSQFNGRAIVQRSVENGEFPLLYFVLDGEECKTVVQWGFFSTLSNIHTPFRNIPTRRKVMAFCHATGIDLLEKS